MHIVGGDVFELQAYGKQVTTTDIEYGFAVNVYFRTLGSMDCSVRQNPLMESKTARDATKAAIFNYIRTDSDLRRVFKPDNKHNFGTWYVPVDLDH